MVSAARQRRDDMGRPPKELTNPETYAERWAVHLRELRKRRFDSQTAFRDALATSGLDVTKQLVSGWELGQREPRLEYLPIIADVLKVRIRALFPDNAD